MTRRTRATVGVEDVVGRGVDEAAARRPLRAARARSPLPTALTRSKMPSSANHCSGRPIALNTSSQPATAGGRDAGLGRVAAHRLDPARKHGCRPVGIPDERPHLVPALEHGGADRVADLAGGAGHEDPHALILCSILASAGTNTARADGARLTGQSAEHRRSTRDPLGRLERDARRRDTAQLDRRVRPEPPGRREAGARCRRRRRRARRPPREVDPAGPGRCAAQGEPAPERPRDHRRGRLGQGPWDPPGRRQRPRAGRGQREALQHLDPDRARRRLPGPLPEDPHVRRRRRRASPTGSRSPRSRATRSSSPTPMASPSASPSVTTCAFPSSTGSSRCAAPG